MSLFSCSGSRGKSCRLQWWWSNDECGGISMLDATLAWDNETVLDAVDCYWSILGDYTFWVEIDSSPVCKTRLSGRDWNNKAIATSFFSSTTRKQQGFWGKKSSEFRRNIVIPTTYRRNTSSEIIPRNLFFPRKSLGIFRRNSEEINFRGNSEDH